jgi:hypothetical protein
MLRALVGWNLEISTVPEPVNVALSIFAGVVLFVLLARSRPGGDRARRWHTAANEWIDAVQPRPHGLGLVLTSDV